MDHDEVPAGRRPRTFAEKVTRLISVMRPPGEPPMSDRAVAARIRARGGAMSAGYFSQLRTGRKTNPSLDHLTAIADAFGISAGYFTDPEIAERVDRELDRLEQRHHTDELQELAARAASLDDSDRATLTQLIDRELAKRAGDAGDTGEQRGNDLDS